MKLMLGMALYLPKELFETMKPQFGDFRKSSCQHTVQLLVWVRYISMYQVAWVFSKTCMIMILLGENVLIYTKNHQELSVFQYLAATICLIILKISYRNWYFSKEFSGVFQKLYLVTLIKKLNLSHKLLLRELMQDLNCKICSFRPMKTVLSSTMKSVAKFE